jgi:cytochrome c peroxidase
VARFKTPGLRDLGHSAPCLHTGRADTLEAVLALYGEFSELARRGRIRNPSPEVAGIAITRADGAALTAFLRSLNEDYA